MRLVHTAVSRDAGGLPDVAETRALLGAEREPPLTVSQCKKIYMELQMQSHIGDSKAQIRAWEKPIIKSNADFIKVVGDRAINEITRNDMRAYKDWLLDRVANGEIKPRTLNANLNAFTKVLSWIVTEKDLNLNLPIKGLQVPAGFAKQRPTFSEKWIEEELLGKGRLDGNPPHG